MGRTLLICVYVIMLAVSSEATIQVTVPTPLSIYDFNKHVSRHYCQYVYFIVSMCTLLSVCVLYCQYVYFKAVSNR